MPPHLFSIADNAYNDMLVSKWSGPVYPSQNEGISYPFPPVSIFPLILPSTYFSLEPITVWNYSQRYQPSLVGDITGYLLSMFLRCTYIKLVKLPLPVADLRGRRGRAPPPWRPKFLHFHAVFGENWQNHRLAPPPGSWRPLLGEILDPPLVTYIMYGTLTTTPQVSRLDSSQC